jgi:hypothetical protein
VADVVRNFTPIVDVARTQDEFLDAVGRASAAPDHELIAQGIERAAQASWDAIVADMERDIRHAIAPSDAGLSALHAQGARMLTLHAMGTHAHGMECSK